MSRLIQAGTSGMFGAALSMGLTRHPDTLYESPTVSGQLHDGAEAEKEAPPALVEIPINRQIRRAIGVSAISLSAPENSIWYEQIVEKIDSVYSAIEHRSKSTKAI